MSSTGGACGSVEGRGILFDREVPCETKLQSFAVRKLKLVVDREKLESVVLGVRMERVSALGRSKKPTRRGECKVPEITR